MLLEGKEFPSATLGHQVSLILHLLLLRAALGTCFQTAETATPASKFVSGTLHEFSMYV